MAIVSNPKEIREQIATFGATGKQWAAQAVMLSNSVCVYTQKSGNCDLINALVEAMPRGGKTIAMRTFLNRFSGAVWNEKCGCFKLRNAKHELRVGEAFESSDLCKAMLEKDWTEYSEEKPTPAFKLANRFGSVIKAAKKALDEGNEKNEINAEMLAELEALAKKYEIKID